MFLLPHGNEFFLAFLTALEVFRVVSLLEGVPVVNDPVGGSYYTLVGDTTDAGGEVSGNRMLQHEQFILALLQQLNGFPHVGDLGILVEPVAEEHRLVTVHIASIIVRLQIT